MDSADTLAVTALVVAGGCLLTVSVLAAWVVRARRRADAALVETDALREELAVLRAARGVPGAADPTGSGPMHESADGVVPEAAAYLITDAGDRPEGPAAPATRIDGRLFADLVLRESVVKAAALAHGVRRAAAPEVRNRIRLEMRREVKRARKQRRADLRRARQHLHAQQRRAAGEDAA
jgi:hypothetical protein